MSDFHLLRPLWLFLLILLVPVLWAWWRQRQQRYGHYGWLAPHLARPLLQLPKQQQRGTGWLLLALALLISSLALAGPTWERLPQPVYQLNAGQVIILDMSLSTRATDVNPDRLTQLRYKARDLLSSRLDGETGLIAYAGDAFVISPLTSDKNNLLNLIPALSPEIMPEQGNYPQVAFSRADEMLRNAGYPTGDIFWLTDGIESRDFTELTNQFRQLGHRVSVLAVGTREGAPVRQTDGSLLRDASGQVVVPRLYPDRLRRLSELTGGVFTRHTVDSQDIERLLSLPPLSRAGQDTDGAPLQQGDQWLDRGPWLALLLLPLALLHWRRNGILGATMLPLLLPLASLSLLLASAGFSTSAQAQEDSFSWWLTAEQRAQQALEQQQYERAANLSENPLRRGTANYRAGNYEAALTDFAQLPDATGYYNQGNALMQLEDYQAAINAYQEALRQQPDLQQAKDNLELAKQQLEQQQDQQQQGEQNQNGADNQGESGEQGSEGEQQQTDDQNQDSGDEAAEGEQPEQPDEPQQEQEQEQEQAAEQESQQPEQQPEPEAGDSEQQAQQAIDSSMDGQLDAEQQREFEQMLKRLPDDPALLLRQKMRLEYQKRQQQQRRPEGVQQQW